jgi:hypothetical protein
MTEMARGSAGERRNPLAGKRLRAIFPGSPGFANWKVPPRFSQPQSLLSETLFNWSVLRPKTDLH